MKSNSMIFLGDIASPNEQTTKQFQKELEKHNPIFANKTLICNLEGLVSDKDLTKTNSPVLYNHSSVIGLLQQYGLKAAGLANNHTLDIPALFSPTIDLLEEKNIAYTGAGYSKEVVSEPAIFDYYDHKVLMFNASWNLLQHHQQNPNQGLYVNTINEKQLLADIKQYKAAYPGAIIITFFHWSFDLETLPFPMNRKFSQDLIGAGVKLVIGTHSHCPQGAERYKDGYIVYGLGNFFVPWHTFINGTIHFPELARMELAFEWDPIENTAHCHWFKYRNEDGKHELDLLESKAFSRSQFNEKYSPYANMGHENYRQFFKKHRRKRILIPVYDDYDATVKNTLFDLYLIMRMRILRLLAKMNLRGWNN